MMKEEIKKAKDLVKKVTGFVGGANLVCALLTLRAELGEDTKHEEEQQLALLRNRKDRREAARERAEAIVAITELYELLEAMEETLEDKAV